MDYLTLQLQMKDPLVRSSIQVSLLKSIKDDLELVDKQNGVDDVDIVNLFRTLRNLCIDCSNNQNKLVNTMIPGMVIDILESHEISDEAVNIGLQFIGNFIAENPRTSEYVWEKAFPNFFYDILRKHPVNDKKISHCSMIIYNCVLTSSSILDMFSDEVSETVLITLCDSVLHVLDPSWIILLIREKLLNTAEFIPLFLSKCSLRTQSYILEIYCDCIGENQNAYANNNDFFVMYLFEVFSERYPIYMKKVSKDHSELFASIILSLCWATARSGKWIERITSSNNIKELVNLLHDLDQFRKEKSTDLDLNFLSLLSKAHVKRDIIRLLGNLCYENVDVQDQMRSFGGISLILDSCSIDDDNPYIQQYAIFAIRNLCNGNIPNQAEITKLEKLGMADSPVLKSMGLTAVEDDNGKVKLKPI